MGLLPPAGVELEGSRPPPVGCEVARERPQRIVNPSAETSALPWHGGCCIAPEGEPRPPDDCTRRSSRSMHPEMEDAALAWFRRGYELHLRGGHAAEAEAAYRQAIAAGAVDAWLNLGLLLWLQRGRETDAVAALREAMASDDVARAAHAAVELGDVLYFLRDDVSAARACYEFAERNGDLPVAFRASGQLAMLLAFDGDTEAARERIRSFSIWYGDERDVDLVGGGAEILAVGLTTLAGARLTREPFRRGRRALFRARRLRRSIIASSRRASLVARRARDARRRAGQRFWHGSNR